MHLALTNLLTYRSTLNQREFVGIISAFNTLHDTVMVNKASQEQLWVDALKCIVRRLLGLHERTPPHTPLETRPLATEDIGM